MSSHRYWRVKATAMDGASSGFMACQELRMLTDWDGPQAATGGTAICDSNYTGLPASQAFDSHYDIRASNGTGTNSWIGYDFGSAVTLKEVWYTPRGDSGFHQIFTAANIDWSDDGSSWTTEVSWTPATWVQGATQGKVVQGSKPADGTAGAGAHRYWRVLARDLDALSTAYVACQQLDWRLTPSGAQAATGGTPLSGTHHVTGATANAYDNDAGTFWACNGVGWDWLGYDFGSAKQIAEIAWTSRDDASAYHQIFTSAVVQSSDDGVAWTTAATITPSTWSQNQTQTFTVQSPAAARAIPRTFVCT